jgi:hypothetical protein
MSRSEMHGWAVSHSLPSSLAARLRIKGSNTQLTVIPHLKIGRSQVTQRPTVLVPN